MKYKYIKTDHFIQGLPANDLDDTELTEEQKVLLATAVESGIYEPASKKKKEEKDA
jgi:hypothetical protein